MPRPNNNQVQDENAAPLNGNVKRRGARRQSPSASPQPKKIRRTYPDDPSKWKEFNIGKMRICVKSDKIYKAKRCTKTSDCLRKYTLQECPKYSECGNNKVQNNSFDKCCVVRQTLTGKGRGVFATKKIPEGTLIGFYAGELITAEEQLERKEKYKKERENDWYFLKAGDYYVDAKNYGNFTRFINHHCAPNTEIQSWKVPGIEGYTPVVFSAIRDIEIDEEITFHYGFSYEKGITQKCLCGARCCNGFIGEAPPNRRARRNRSAPPRRKPTSRPAPPRKGRSVSRPRPTTRGNRRNTARSSTPSPRVTRSKYAAALALPTTSRAAIPASSPGQVKQAPRASRSTKRQQPGTANNNRRSATPTQRITRSKFASAAAVMPAPSHPVVRTPSPVFQPPSPVRSSPVQPNSNQSIPNLVVPSNLKTVDEVKNWLLHNSTNGAIEMLKVAKKLLRAAADQQMKTLLKEVVASLVESMRHRSNRNLSK